MSHRARPRRDDPPDDESEEEARRRALSTSESGSPNCLTVGLDCRSMNLYRFLRVRFPRAPHGTLRGWIVDGHVTVNGTPVTDSRPLRFGDVVEIDADVERTARPAKKTGLVELYSDASLVAVDKPAGLATAGERDDKRPHLLGLVKRAHPDDKVKLVHRIDKPASGVVVFAKSREAKQRLHEEFAARRVVKDYLALVSGHVDDAPQIVAASLSPRRGRVSKMVVTPNHGKPAVTLVRPLLRFRGYTLVHARPVSGRTHQIRAHLRHLGHSIVGDATYDGEPALLLSKLKFGYRKSRGEDERPLLARLALHAFRIRLASPATGAAVTCTSPLPKDLRSAIRQLQKSAGTRIVADLEAQLADPLGEPGSDPFAALEPQALAELTRGRGGADASNDAAPDGAPDDGPDGGSAGD
jgi:RluA family pseudouridine synthase